MSPRVARIFTLYQKEWMRIKRNPAALMAVGLIILMAFLVNIENKARKQEKIQESQPCALVFSTEDSFIKHLKSLPESQKIRFIQTEQLVISSTLNYPANIRCVAEIYPEASVEQVMHRRIKFRMVGESPQLQQLSRWVIASFANFNAKVKLDFSISAMQNNTPTKTLGNIDLSTSGSKAIVGAMLLFSAQYFLCFALFISFSAHERERGILQALALTATSAGELLLSKILFHLSLSWVASMIIMQTLSPYNIWAFPANLLANGVVILSSLGLISVAAIITSLNRTQTSASLVGFCYLMLMGVIFALAPKFIAFNAIRTFMFEGHAILLFTVILDNFSKPNMVKAGGALIFLLWQPVLLLFIASIIWKKHGWHNP